MNVMMAMNGAGNYQLRNDDGGMSAPSRLGIKALPIYKIHFIIAVHRFAQPASIHLCAYSSKDARATHTHKAAWLFADDEYK